MIDLETKFVNFIKKFNKFKNKPPICEIVHEFVKKTDQFWKKKESLIWKKNARI